MVPSFLARIARARNLSRRLSRAAALRLAFAGAEGRPRALAVAGVAGPVWLRPGGIDVTVFEKIFLADEYELPFTAAPRRIVDAGAHIGLASRFFAHRYPAARILALEPMAANLAVLRRNAAVAPQIEVLPGALWGRSAPLAGSGGESWAHVMAEAGPADPGAIRGITIPDILAHTGWDRIDLLKLDVEGAEREIFAAGAAAWLPRVGAIAIELHDRFAPGCSAAFYGQVSPRLELQEIRGETVFVRLKP